MKVKLLLEKAAKYAEKAAADPGSARGVRWMEISNLYIKMAEVLAGFETAQ